MFDLVFTEVQGIFKVRNCQPDMMISDHNVIQWNSDVLKEDMIRKYVK